MVKGIHWLGHASFRIDNSLTIYIDPWKVQDPRPADVILVTHAHFDHCSPKDIRKLTKEGTIIVCPQSCVGQLQGDVRPVKPGDVLDLGKIRIEAVPSYNTNKPNHPREANNVGYVVEFEGQRIYHAGDTDLIPEMANIRCDVALLPVGGTYTMDADEAARALEQIKPKVAIPMHWGDIVGSRKDAERFAQKAPKEVQVVILDPEQ